MQGTVSLRCKLKVVKFMCHICALLLSGSDIRFLITIGLEPESDSKNSQISGHWEPEPDIRYIPIDDAVMMMVMMLVMLVQPNVEELDKNVNELKKVLTDAKLKGRHPGGVTGATPPTASCNATPEKSSNFSPLGRPDIRRLKSEDEKSDSSFGLVAGTVCYTVKHFRCILISQFRKVEITLHFNLAFSQCSTSIYQAFDGQTEFSQVLIS